MIFSKILIKPFPLIDENFPFAIPTFFITRTKRIRMKYMKEICPVIRSTWINDPKCRTRMTRERVRVATCLSQRNIRNTILWIASEDDPSTLYWRDQHQPHLHEHIGLQACYSSSWLVYHESSSMSHVYGRVCCKNHTICEVCP